MADIIQKLGFEAKSAISTLSALTSKLNAANTSLKNIQNTAGGASLDKITKSTKKAGQAANEFTVSWKTMARVVQTQIIVRGLNVLIQTMTKGIEDARQLGLAIAEIQTISGGAVGTSGQLTASLIKMSDALGTGAKVLAEGFYQTLSNQVVEAGEAMNFTSEAAKLATITHSETGDAVNALSSVMNSYSLSAEQAEHVSGTLLKTIELGRLRMSEIANVIGRVTPLTAKLGITWEETAASIAVMTRQGVRADTAITQLRAVVTKLIKPTDEVRAIFHKWGVEDAPQAIATFGGLGGVLKKLAQETGGSTQAMVALLRNVRAIAGQLGIMTDEGRQLAEALEEIEGATTAATEAWDGFAKSDAHKLTVELERLTNRATQLGVTVLPTVSRGLELVNNTVSKLHDGFRVLTGQVGVAAIAANTLEANQIAAVAEIKKLNKEFAEDQREGYKGVAEAAAKYYVFAAQEENRLAGIRDESIKLATAGLKVAGQNIIDFYKTNLDEITNFVKNADKQVQDSFKSAAKVREELNKRLLDRQLKQAGSADKKLAILRALRRKQEEKLNKAALKVDVTKESLEALEIEVGHTRALADRIVAIEKAAGLRREAANTEKYIDELLRFQSKAILNHAWLIESNTDKVKKQIDKWKEGEERLKHIAKRLKELRKETAATTDPRVEARVKKEADVLIAEQKRVLEEAEKSSKLLQTLGLTASDFSIVASGLQVAFDQARFDWEGEVARAKAVFAREIIPIKVVLDQGGGTAATEALGLEKGEGESLQGFSRRRDAAALTRLSEHEGAQHKIEKAQKRINAQLNSGASFLDQINKRTATYSRGFGQITGQVKTFAKTSAELAALDQTNTEGKQKALQIANTLEKENKDLAFEAFELGSQIHEKMKQNIVVRQDEIDQYAEVLQSARDQKQVTGEMETLFGKFNKTLNTGVPLLKEMATLTEQLMTPEQLEAVTIYKDSLVEMGEAAQTQAEASTTTEEKIKSIRTTLDELIPKAEQTSNAYGETANSASSAALSTGAMGTNASNSLSSVNALATAYGKLAANAERAAKAQAGAGGAALAFHGGPMSRFFANGGTAGRGQDKIGAYLAKGETVVNAKSSRSFFSELNAMNQGSQPVFREQGGPVTNVGDVNVTVNGGDSSQQTVREIGRALRREVKRGNIKLN